MLYTGPGTAPTAWPSPPDWESMIADRYEVPLAAIYTPWLLVMVGAVLAGVQRGSEDRIPGGIFATTILLSVAFNVVVCWMLFELLFRLRPLSNEIPSKEPLVALLISIIGAFVTYNFPKAEETQPVAGQPAGNPAAPPQDSGVMKTEDAGRKG